MSKEITKATIQRLAESQGRSETNQQVLTARYDQCKDNTERIALLAEINRAGGGVKSKEQNKAVTSGTTKVATPAKIKAPAKDAAPSKSEG
jgi:hydroxyethylthiazole kinase-like sugar kinase family protein